jgi:glycosyltransferase involved in cell wall biosynthesis
MRILIDLQAAQPRSNRVRGIGRYSISFAEALIREARDHEVWLVFGGGHPDSIGDLRTTFVDLVPEDRMRVFEVPLPVNELDPANFWRTRSAEFLREKFLADLRPDIIHVSSICEGATNEIVVSIGQFAPELVTSVLLYDLVPLLDPKSYLHNKFYERSYLRHLQFLRQANLVLTISESSRAEAIDVLHIPSDRVINIGAGVSAFGPEKTALGRDKALLERYRIDRPFVLYTGGADARKNIGGLIAAFASLPVSVRQEHRLVLAGTMTEQHQMELRSVAEAKGLRREEALFLGYVPDEDLAGLYSACSVFILPSFHEGFGLPLLEAMACGAPVLGSNTTSIPEIINRPDALFDPRQPQEMAQQITLVLTDQDFRRDLKVWGPERAKSFTWKNCARKALHTFETIHAKRTVRALNTSTFFPRRRRTLAIISPLLSETTPIARHMSNVLPHLQSYYDILCISNQPDTIDPWLAAIFPIKSLAWFENHALDIERILYVVGNGSSFQTASRLLQSAPGIVALLDSYLEHFPSETEINETQNVCRILFESYGYTALLAYQTQGRERALANFPCPANLLRNGVGVIARSQSDMDTMRKWSGISGSLNVRSLQTSEALTVFAEHAVASTARGYWSLVEDLYETSAIAREVELLRAIARIRTGNRPTTSDLAAVASSISLNRERIGPKRAFLDISAVARENPTMRQDEYPRNLLKTLLSVSSTDYLAEPVYAASATYRYARGWTYRFLGLHPVGYEDDIIGTSPGDIFLSVAPLSDTPAESVAWLEAQKNRGLIVYSLDAMTLEQNSQIQSLEQLLEVAAVRSGKSATILDKDSSP